MPQPLRLRCPSFVHGHLLLIPAAAGLLSPLGCASTVQNRVQCELDAVVQALPSDPDELTLGDLKAVAHRLRECHARQASPPARDAGG